MGLGSNRLGGQRQHLLNALEVLVEEVAPRRVLVRPARLRPHHRAPRVARLPTRTRTGTGTLTSSGRRRGRRRRRRITQRQRGRRQARRCRRLLCSARETTSDVSHASASANSYFATCVHYVLLQSTLYTLHSTLALVSRSIEALQSSLLSSSLPRKMK